MLPCDTSDVKVPGPIEWKTKSRNMAPIPTQAMLNSNSTTPDGADGVPILLYKHSFNSISRFSVLISSQMADPSIIRFVCDALSSIFGTSNDKTNAYNIRVKRNCAYLPRTSLKDSVITWDHSVLYGGKSQHVAWCDPRKSIRRRRSCAHAQYGKVSLTPDIQKQANPYSYMYLFFHHKNVILTACLVDLNKYRENTGTRALKNREGKHNIYI